MGAMKVVKALEENWHIKNINHKVRRHIKNCFICQLVKSNNEKKEGVMIPITSQKKLEKVFLDICGPFPRSGGRHRYKYIIIMMDHFTKFIKLYPVNRATTLKVLGVITNQYLPEIGKPMSIITDHGTQFKGRRWRDTLLALGIKTYKTSVYHPSSNPAERVLREVGRILRTYCHRQLKKWQEYLSATEEFLNLPHHPAIGITPFTATYEKPPPREVQEIIEFPPNTEYKFDQIKFYNKLAEDQERRNYKL